MLSTFLEATFVIGVIGIISVAGRFLDAKGVAAAVPIGYTVYLLGGRAYFLVMFVFFVVAGFTTRYRYREKYGEGGRGMRTWSNVLANGSAAALITVYGYLSNMEDEATFAMFLGSISAVFSDTMSTEIGLLSKNPPRMITSLKQVDPGTPGGVSPRGLLAGFFTGFILAAAVYLYGIVFNQNYSLTSLALLSMISGFTGSLFDSVVGGVFQSRYTCQVCGKIVEVKKHCGKPSIYLTGYSYVNNELVNVFASLYGAFVAYVVWLYIR